MVQLEDELIAYEAKCEQLETEISQIESEKNDILEAYAKSWGHHNEKQKIKYTGRIIKDIDSITQVTFKKESFYKFLLYVFTVYMF